MKNLIELSNFAVKNFSSKCTTPSEIECDGEVIIKMYVKMFSSEYFQFKATILFIFDAQQSYKARKPLF